MRSGYPIPLESFNAQGPMIPMLLFTLFLACPKNTTMSDKTSIPTPPKATVVPHTHTEHGVERSDPYYWLRNKTDPAVINYIEAENEYTEQQSKPLEPMRKQLFDEMLSRIQEDDQTVPYQDGDYWYYSRTESGKPYRIYCRKHLSLDGEEEIILDENQLAEGLEYFDLGSLAVSHDHSMLAYTTDTNGREIYELQIKNLESGEILPDRQEALVGRIMWANDNQTLFYSRMDDALRPDRIFRYTLGQKSSEILVYEEKDELFRVGFWKGNSERFLYFYSASTLTSEVHYLSADSPEKDLTVISERHAGMEYWPEDHGNDFIIVTNDCDDENGVHTSCALNNKLMRTPIQQSDRSHWVEEIPHRKDVQLQGVDIYQDQWILSERANGLDQFRVIDFKNKSDYIISLPEPSYLIYGSSNPSYKTRKFRYGYASLVSPSSTFELDLDTNTQEILKEHPVNNYDRSQYTAERIFIPSHDGVEIPVSIVYRKDLDRSQPQPIYLYGYGSYGASLDPYFSSSRLSLLDRGVIFAMAHIRGGGEMGRQWYEDGKFLKKKNTFLDFVAVSEGLIQQGYTNSDKLSIIGGSAGGLLIGASINMRPDLYNAAVADVPFVDVVTTMLDDSIPLTTGEWEEWGNPAEKNYFDYMLSYSPYDNVTSQNYPHLLVTSGLNDPRVQYWEPTKWVAKLRVTKTDTNQLLLRTNMGAGHGGNSGRYGYLEDLAFEYAFLLDKWGLTELNSESSATPTQ